jgi:F-type H+-transporting ATPase subunit epsilon
MADPKRVQVIVVTPERAVLDEAVESAVIPLYDGELGILPGRASLVARLGPGELRFPTDGGTRRLFIDGGFVQVNSSGGRTTVTLLTPKAFPADTVTVAMSQEAMQHAEAMPTTSAVERDNRYRAQERARALARVAARSATTVG